MHEKFRLNDVLQCYLACSAKLPTMLYILPSFSFFKWSKAIPGSTGFSRFFFTKWKVFVWMLSIQTSFFWFLKGCCLATNFWQNWRNDLHSAPWHFKTGLEYRNMNIDKQLYSANDPSTSCTNCVNFGPVTPEIEVCEICTFETIPQKSAYLTKYLNNYWTDLHQNLSFGRGIGAYVQIIKLT